MSSSILKTNDKHIGVSKDYREITILYDTVVQASLGTQSYLGQYGSINCYEDDYDDIDYTFEISIEKFKDMSDEVTYLIDDIGVDISSPEKVVNMLNFIIDTKCWKDILSRLDEEAQETFNNKK